MAIIGGIPYFQTNIKWKLELWNPGRLRSLPNLALAEALSETPRDFDTVFWRGEARRNSVWNHGNSTSCKVWNNLNHFNLCDWQVMFCDVHLWCTRQNFDDSWPRRCSSCLGCNLFSLFQKLTQTIKIGLDWHFWVFFGCLHVLIHQVPSHHFLGTRRNSFIQFLRSYQHAKCTRMHQYTIHYHCWCAAIGNMHTLYTSIYYRSL